MPAVTAEEKAGGAATRIEVISTGKAPRSVGPFSRGIRAGAFIFCSGQGAFDPATGKLVKGGGSGLDRVVRVTVLLSDWKYFREMNEAYAEFFSADRPPARSTVQGERWPEGHLVAMEAIALAE